MLKEAVMRNALSIITWTMTTVGFWLILLSAICMVIRVKLGCVDKGISLIDSNGCRIDGFYDSRYATFTVMYYIVVLSTLATDRHREALADYLSTRRIIFNKSLTAGII